MQQKRLNPTQHLFNSLYYTYPNSIKYLSATDTGASYNYNTSEHILQGLIELSHRPTQVVLPNS